MKLGISMLVFGLLLAGVGVTAWMYADPELSFWGVSQLNIDEAQMVKAAGIGVAVLGGGLAIGGIVRMIVKR